MILPVYGSHNNEKKHFGSAFILSSGLLITAGHNLRNDYDEKFDSIFVEINDSKFVLDNPLFHEYESEYNSNIDNYLDLAIFRPKYCCNGISELTLEPSELPDEATMKGFIVNGLQLETIESRIVTKEYSYRSYDYFDASKSVKFKNCFCLSHPTAPGISGGPVLDGLNVVGMIVYGHELSGPSAIKASYIIEKINELNQ